MSLPNYTGPIERSWFYLVRGFALLVLLFLVVPILVIIPLSFNVEPYFSFTHEMLRLNPDAFSLRWYHQLASDPLWALSIKNSFLVACGATVIATTLGTLASIGLSRSDLPYKRLLTGILISPMIVPVIISAAGMYFFYSKLGIGQSLLALVLSHAVLGTPFVILTVTATLVSFDHSLVRAAASMGASASYTFFRITFPLIRPGIISGGLFAFITSFDEAVVVQFLGGVEQRTIPRQMWSGMREQISPTILAAATLLIVLSVVLLLLIEVLRRRSLRVRGITQ